MGNWKVLVIFGAVFAASFGHAAESTERAQSILQIDQIKPENNKKLNGEWNFSFGARGFEEGKDEGVASFIYLRTKLNYYLLENLHIHAAPRLDLYSSRLQARYEDDYYDNKIRLMNAYILYAPVEQVDLKLGAHSQELLEAPIVISRRRVFPGAQEIFRWNFPAMRLEILAQQLVPTSSSLNTERGEKEKLPGFFTESLSLKNSKLSDEVQWKVRGGHFRWQNLPSRTAFDSTLLGNTTFGETAANSRFAHAFEGWFAGFEGCFCKYSLQLVGEFDRLQNTLAPANAADGQMIGVGPRLVTKNIDYDLRVRSFFVESDATIAFHNAATFGGTNRIGEQYKVAMDLKKLGFFVEAWFNQSRAINANSVQKTQNEYYLGLESHYVAF